MSNNFNALLLSDNGGNVSSEITELTRDQLPAGDVVVRISHSSLNYKDAMILKGQGRLVRSYPHIPGIDFAGIVEESDSPDFAPGDAVVLTGWRVGEMIWGGYSELARVKADWLVKLPSGLSAAQAMAIGTAGFTAMLAIMALESHGLTPGGTVLVTGANGGVGSVAIALLAQLGFAPVAATGRPEESAYLNALGATRIVDRSELTQTLSRPLLSEQWDGCVDAVGGLMLANAIAGVRYGGAVSACGLAGGNELTGTILPFLLRGVSLLGIDSVMCPKPRRLETWQRIGEVVPAEALAKITSHIPLEQLPDAAGEILAGRIRGRVVVDVA